jgi:hypothetical protein
VYEAYTGARRGIGLADALQAYQEASGLTEEVVAAFEKIDGYVEEMGLLGEIKSKPLYKAVNRLFMSIVTFIAAAASYLGQRVIGECFQESEAALNSAYQHDTHLVKMVMFLGGKNDKFKDLIKSIGAAHEEVARVRALVGLAVNLASLQKMDKETREIRTGRCATMAE